MLLYRLERYTCGQKGDKTVGGILSAPFPMPRSHLTEEGAQSLYSVLSYPTQALQALSTHLRFMRLLLTTLSDYYEQLAAKWLQSLLG